MIGVPTRDHRVLMRPEEGAPLVQGQYPLPLYGAPLNYNAAAAQDALIDLGHIDALHIEEDRLVATGVLNSTPLAQDYAAVLRLRGAGPVLDAAGGEVAEATGEPRQVITGWHVTGVTVVRRPAWDLPPVELHPAPWGEPVLPVAATSL